MLNDIKVDAEGRGHLDAVNTMVALRTVNPSLSDADEKFIYTVSILRVIVYLTKARFPLAELTARVNGPS